MKVKVNQNVNVKGQGQAKGQIHLIGYNFASNCHRYLVHILVYEKLRQILVYEKLRQI